MKGYVHSVETFGTVDGPGIRYVVFFQGCPLRCKFCHNPDTWRCGAGREMDAAEVVEDILKYRNYIQSGGVTLSGGEPLLQPEFAAAILRGCAEHGIHTAVDTSGIVPLSNCREAVDAANLILLDIKHIDAAKARELTGQDNRNALELLDYCERTGKEVWIRHVVIPGLTDDPEPLERMARYLSGFTTIRRIEILPFHKMGEFKWKQLGLEYELGDTPEPTAESIQRIREIFIKQGLPV